MIALCIPGYRVLSIKARRHDHYSGNRSNHEIHAGNRLAGVKRLLRALSCRLGLVVLAYFLFVMERRFEWILELPWDEHVRALKAEMDTLSGAGWLLNMRAKALWQGVLKELEPYIEPLRDFMCRN